MTAQTRTSDPEWWAQVHSAPETGRGRPRLDINQLADAALEIIDRQGLQHLSMRTLAASRGFSTATVYRRLGGQAGLHDLVVERVLGEAHRQIEQLRLERWQDVCLLGFEAFFRAVALHPNVAPLMATRVPTGPHANALREFVLSALLTAGFDVKLAARTYTTLAQYTLGFALQLRTSGPDRAPTDASPATLRVADYLDADLLDEFQFGLRMLTIGVESVLRDPSVDSTP